MMILTKSTAEPASDSSVAPATCPEKPATDVQSSPIPQRAAASEVCYVHRIGDNLQCMGKDICYMYLQVFIGLDADNMAQQSQVLYATGANLQQQLTAL